MTDRDRLENALIGESLLGPQELVIALCDLGIASDLCVSLSDVATSDLVRGLNYFRST